MIANYHTHTWRCHHASGSEREYVERAIEGGLRILGFADHSPYLFPDGYVSGHRMLPSQFEDYVTVLSDLKKEYARDIEIHIGVEAEYYPKLWNGLMNFLKDYPVEYFIMGQHYLRNENDPRIYSGTPTHSREHMSAYVDQVLEGLRTGCFTYLAHPDLVNLLEDPDFFRQEATRLCRAVKEMDLPLEINLLGLEEGRHYPYEPFWEVVHETGNKVIIGCDAHSPRAVYQPDVIQKAYDLAARYQLNLLDTVELVNPFADRKDPMEPLKL